MPAPPNCSSLRAATTGCAPGVIPQNRTAQNGIIVPSSSITSAPRPLAFGRRELLVGFSLFAGQIKVDAFGAFLETVIMPPVRLYRFAFAVFSLAVMQ